MGKHFIAVVACLCLTGCSRPALYKDTRVLMGTFVEVTSADRRAAGIVFDEFIRLEKLLSAYDPHSELSRLNRDGSIAAGDDLLFIVRHSLRFWRDTQGAFDITVGPLIELWGFGDRQFRIPAAEAVSAALRQVGMDKIIVQEDAHMIQFIIPGVQVNAGGIAKGYALDQAVLRLKQQGIASCLINAGGQVYALGQRSAGRPWKVALRDPRSRGVLQETIELRDSSVSTSGDYEQFFEADGIRYSHIFDPRSGYPVDNGVAAVTVIAADAVTADALSTAAFVLGPAPARALEQKFPGVKIRIFMRDVPHT